MTRKKLPKIDAGEESPLNIDVGTISYIIERVQEAYGDMPTMDDTDDAATASKGADTGFREIAAFIDDLNDDQRFDLVALMWVGRGTYSADEIEQARTDARREATHSTSDYLLATPLVGDYLANGLEAFGLSIE